LHLARICALDVRSWSGDDTNLHRLTTVLLRAMASDRQVTTATAVAVLETITRTSQWPIDPIASEIAACTLSFLRRSEQADDVQPQLVPILDLIDPNVLDPALRGQVRDLVKQLGLQGNLRWIVDDASS
jgi:hypothetical protein